jgi:hypothetical protein
VLSGDHSLRFGIPDPRASGAPQNRRTVGIGGYGPFKPSKLDL